LDGCSLPSNQHRWSPLLNNAVLENPNFGNQKLRENQWKTNGFNAFLILSHTKLLNLVNPIVGFASHCLGVTTTFSWI
jgi:hypothetical protein